MNKIQKVSVELIDEKGKVYKGTLDREVKPIQPDETQAPIKYIPISENNLSAGFVVQPGVFTVRYADGTPERKARVLPGGKLMHVAA